MATIEELKKNRLKKLEAVINSGLNPYPEKS